MVLSNSQTRGLCQAGMQGDVPAGVGSLSCETRVGVAVAFVDATAAGFCAAAACCARAVLISDARSAVCAEQKPPHMSSRAADTSSTCVLAISAS